MWAHSHSVRVPNQIPTRHYHQRRQTLRPLPGRARSWWSAAVQRAGQLVVVLPLLGRPGRTHRPAPPTAVACQTMKRRRRCYCCWRRRYCCCQSPRRLRRTRHPSRTPPRQEGRLHQRGYRMPCRRCRIRRHQLRCEIPEQEPPPPDCQSQELPAAAAAAAAGRTRRLRNRTRGAPVVVVVVVAAAEADRSHPRRRIRSRRSRSRRFRSQPYVCLRVCS